MAKKYTVYWKWDTTEEGDNCNHNFKEFDDITTAAEYFNQLGATEKTILKLVTWKTVITVITDITE